jgi:hypothetical protein
MRSKRLLRFVGERVGRTKVPRELAFTDELPLGPSGKVLKRTLPVALRMAILPKSQEPPFCRRATAATLPLDVDAYRPQTSLTMVCMRATWPSTIFQN